MGGRRRTKPWQRVGLAGHSSSLLHALSFLAYARSLDPAGVSPTCSSKLKAEPGLWGDPSAGAGFPVQAQ